jgi:hypothetical protein
VTLVLPRFAPLAVRTGSYPEASVQLMRSADLHPKAASFKGVDGCTEGYAMYFSVFRSDSHHQHAVCLLPGSTSGEWPTMPVSGKDAVKRMTKWNYFAVTLQL